MAVKCIAASCVLFFALASCQAKPENCSEARCKLLPVENELASKFHIKATEKGVRMVYLNLKIGNDSYHPLELADEFLPNRWVWANSINEPMLSLSYDYDILSLGLLTYQVRSVDVPLQDQPSGCLASLNSSCQNKVVGRTLLNVTQHYSGKSLQGRDIVCVAIIEDASVLGDFFWTFSDGNVKYHCCEKSIQGSTEEFLIQCELDVQSSGWFKAFYGSLNILTVLMMLFCPAFLLLLPDFIFNLKEECRNEELRDERLQQQGSRSHDSQTSRQTTGYVSNDQTSVTCDINGEDGEFPLISFSENKTIQDQSQPENSQRSENRSTKESLLYLDEPSPITCSNFFRTYTEEFPELFPFNVKLAFLWYCIIPIFVYIKLGLNYTIERNFIEETGRKPQASLVGPLFSFLFNFKSFISITIVVAPLIMILFSSPKDFLLTGKDLAISVQCAICGENTSSIAEDTLQHLEKLAVKIYNSASCLITFHRKCLVDSINCCTHHCLQNMGPPCRRIKHPFIVLWVLFCNVILITLLGAVLGGFYLCVFLIWSCLLILWYSPLLSLTYVLVRKGLQVAQSVIMQWVITEEVKFPYRIFKTGVFLLIEFFLLLYHIFALVICATACLVGGLSCRFIARMFGFIILGLVLNAEIVSPFVAFFLVASTNMYLCYYNLQMRYQDVKQMISQKWQTQDGQSEQGAIPEDLFWHICSEASESKHKVLPVRPEINRMLRSMTFILIFLFLVFCSIFLVNAYDISAVASSIAVFISGAIPGLFFKGLTMKKGFTGATRSRMMEEIEEAVKEYKAKSRNRDSQESNQGNLGLQP